MAEEASKDWRENLPPAAKAWLQGRSIDEVECFIPDFVGNARGKAMPAKKFSLDQPSYLAISLFWNTVAGTYPDHGPDEAWLTEGDMVLRPDMSTATAVPWLADRSIQVIADLETSDGDPIAIAPRNVLRRVLGLYAAEGWNPIIAPEMEFYLTSPNVDPNLDVEPPIGRTGRRGVGRQPYTISAIEEYGEVIDDIYDFAEAQGLGIDAITQESGAGQIEINLNHGNPLELADQVFHFKRSIREAALKNGSFATFMAKPMKNEPGSAMHIHQSVCDVKTGKNIFSDANGQPTAEFDGMIAGLQTYLPNVLLLLAPYVNSYRRFIADASAPINFEWASDNRTAGIRVPVSSPEARRVENRIVGMDCNPYLAIAANLACGYLGMKKQLKPRKPKAGVAYQAGAGIPRSLNAALELFKENHEIRDIFHEQFCSVYERIKEQELTDFLSEISPWEREHLLLTV